MVVIYRARLVAIRGLARMLFVAAAAIFAGRVPAQAQTNVGVDTFHPGHAVSPELYGAFFEEINYGGVGGMYAEEVRNRAFMDPTTPTSWATASDATRVAGKFGTAVKLNGTSSLRSVALPNGTVDGLHDFTISAWVNPQAVSTWQRVFDFGTGQTANMFLTASAGSTPRFAITASGNGSEQRLDAPSALVLNTWTSLTVTHAGNVGKLYVNGALVATNNNMTLSPADLGATTSNWIGKSQYASDPLLNAMVDDFQIYDHALSDSDVQALQTAPGAGNVASYRFDEPGGATVIDSSGSHRDATIQVTNGGDWTVVSDGGGSVSASLDSTTPLNDQLSRSLKMQIGALSVGQRVGMTNGGYFGIPVTPGRTYTASFWAKAGDGFTSPLTVSIEKADGSQTFASATVSGLSTDWKHYTTTLAVPAGGLPSSANRLVVGVDNRGGTAATAAGTVWLQVVSLFPPTYKGEPNGLRPDLVQKLVDMHPKIFRFPGGNYIEGNYTANDPWGTRWQWKKTIGPVEQRPGHQNAAWGYWDDDGLGLDEFLRLSEDLGATPVVGVFDGESLGGSGSLNIVPQDQMGPYVQDALDEIQYMIGGTDTPWGAKRAANGHAAPYPTPYIEVGNEDNLNRGTASYDAYRYPMFYDAIKAAYPQIKVVATTRVTSRPMDVIDEHYYQSSATFQAQANRYDSYDRNGPKVFVGEYADREGANPPTGSLGRSLGEAAFMTGMERNSDIVTMSSYAPLFNYVGHEQWDPDLIGFDQQTSWGSTSYYVQKLFATNLGDHVLPVTVPSGSGLFSSSTVDSATGRIYTKLVNPGTTDKPTTLTFTGTNLSTAKLEVLSDPDPNAGDSLADQYHVVPKTSTLTGTNGVFSYTAPSNSLTVITLTPEVSASGDVGGSVPATLSLTLGTAASFGAFTPGVANDYSATTTANVISTAGDATLSVADPSPTATGHLVNGTFSLPSPLTLGGSPLPAVGKTYSGPVSNDVATLTFGQHIGANDALRTGSYSKTLTFTLSTTNP